MNQSADRLVLSGGIGNSNQLSLYDRYGAVAYGVILQILPQPLLAQEVLVDLFASPTLQREMATSTNAVCTIVRLARAGALDFRQRTQAPTPVLPPSTRQNELIFNLLFYHNQPVDSIAEQLQMQRSAVVSAVREFFAHLLPAKLHRS